jgi:hypothetical protein
VAGGRGLKAVALDVDARGMRGARCACLGIALLAAVSCAGRGGTGGAERAARGLYETSRTLNGLESNLDTVSCMESATQARNDDITLYDCTLRFDEGGTASWCVVDGSARTAPIPVACSTIPGEYLAAGT